MRVFISWSGDRSRAVADLLDEWLRCVLQAITPWMSTRDIDRGSLWFSEISEQLKETKIGIVCLTAENKEQPWILFEAGALAKGITSTRVCTFLVDLEPTDIANPLAQFNHTKPDQEGLYELVRTLNAALGERALPDKVVERVFDTYWSKFEQSFQQILTDTPSGSVEPRRTEANMTEEVLRTVRALDRRIHGLERMTILRAGTAEHSERITAAAAEEPIRTMLDAGMSTEDIMNRTWGDLRPRPVRRSTVRRGSRPDEEPPSDDD